MKWSKTTKDILSHTSALALLLRYADADSLEDVVDRLQEFRDAFVRDGVDDVLPCSGKNADKDGALSDTYLTEAIKEIAKERLSYYDT